MYQEQRVGSEDTENGSVIVTYVPSNSAAQGRGMFSLLGWFSLRREEGGDAQSWEVLGCMG